MGEEAGPSGAPAATGGDRPAGDARAKLAELASRKRKEAEEAAAREAAKKKRQRPAPAVDFGDSDDSDGEGGGGGAAAAPPPPAALPPGADDDDAVPLRMDDADRAFIDDDGVDADQRVDFEDDGDLAARGDAQAEEGDGDDSGAEMELGDELDRMFSKGRRGRGGGGGDGDGGGGAEARRRIDELLGLMEAAAEADRDDYAAGRPALAKLRLLGRVEGALSERRRHGEMLDAGLLGVLKAWLDPMPDGALPNARVRGAVLGALARLAVLDCAYDDRREQLKRSGLGRVVMFLSKLPDETPANRRAAKALVERWSRPILAPRARAVPEEERERILEARAARAAAAAAAAGAAAAADGDDGPSPGPRPGQAGFRYRAAVPAAAPLDFVNRPASKAVMAAGKGGGAGGDRAPEHRLQKKLRALGKAAPQRAAHVSVEGRNVTLQH